MAPKKEKDPNAPKRSMSGFFFFSQAKRADIQRAHSDWKITQVAQELGRLWKGMSAAQKKPYEDSAAKDKIRYENDMKHYKAGGSTAGKKRASDGAGGAGGKKGRRWTARNH